MTATATSRATSLRRRVHPRRPAGAGVTISPVPPRSLPLPRSPRSARLGPAAPAVEQVERTHPSGWVRLRGAVLLAVMVVALGTLLALAVLAGAGAVAHLVARAAA